MMRPFTSPTAWLTAAVVLFLAACRPADMGPETARAFAEGRSFRDTLVAASERPPATAGDTARLLALGYLERARIGLGSPFRLVDMVLVDPRLPDPVRTRTGWALLAMVYDRHVYEVDPAALDSLFASPTANVRGAAAAQLRLVDAVVRGSDTPRAGELAIRLAYTDAGAERVLRSTAPLTVARVAAQLRDRELARADLLDLLRASRERQSSPVRLVPAWRLARRFAVEQPVMEQLSAEEERDAVARVPSILAALREAGQAPLRELRSPLIARGDRPSPLPPAADAEGAGDRLGPLLSPPAAERLAVLPQVHALPPSPPVSVAVAASRDRVNGEGGVSATVALARSRFLRRSVNEETLVAEYGRLGSLAGRHVAEATLWAASALRPYAQETPWFPGSGGPTAAELRQRFGLASVSFDQEVPAEWRPFYRRQLAVALDDVRRVLPGLSVTGLGIHFGQRPLRAALAVHDPRSRTIFLPLSSGGGAVAHELAHDLDWQAAARAGRRRGDYGTDQAVRDQRGKLAASVQGLTTATLEAPGPSNSFRTSHNVRPTEVFAASADWFVAAALARDGRLNGYLTAVQDELLTGYAAVQPPDLHGHSGEATLAVLDEMTAVPPPLQAWFRARYGHQREPSSFDRTRRVLDVSGRSAGQAPGPARLYLGEPGRQASAVLLPPLVLGASDSPPDPFQQWPNCVARDPDGSPLAAARSQASALAAESVARRLLVRRGRSAPGSIAALVAAGAPVDPALLEAELRRLTAVLLGGVESPENGC